MSTNVLSLRPVWLIAWCGITLSALPVEAAMWDFADDFLASPNQTNTSSSRWQYLNAADGVRDGSYLQMAYFSLAYGANPGLQGWDAFETDGTDPAVIKNVTTTNITYGSSVIPGGAVRVSPGTAGNDLGIVGWLSPSNMTVRIQIEINDIDPSGGYISWWLDIGDSSGNLASGTLLNNNSTNFSIASLDVAMGDMVYLVMNNAGHPAYDNYTVEFSVLQIPEIPASSFVLIPFFGWALIRHARNRRPGGLSEKGQITR